jgi:hypothetical protein
LDGFEEEFGDTGLLNIDEVRLEQALGCFETLAADSNYAAVRESVRFHQDRGVFA